MDYGENLHKCREYITALEEEKRKIEMFQRELPLCLELVSQAIENYKQQLVGITTTATTTLSPATVAGPTATTTDQCLNGQSECSEQTTSDCPPPVLEEFMPIRRPTSNSTDEEEEGSYNHHHDELESRHNNNSKWLDNDLQNGTSVKKADWLRSVQLWNQTVPDPPDMEERRNLNYQQPRKVQVVEVKTSGSGGAFHPFQKALNSSGSSVVQHQSHHVVKPAVIIPPTTATIKSAIRVGTPSTTTRPPNAQANIAASSGERSAAAAVGGSTTEAAVAASNKKEEGSSSKDGSGGSSASRKARRCWSPELHKKFLNALQQLGGSHVATPKQIRELMKVDGLTNDEVKSHLQKYRLHTRRISPTIHNNTNTQQPPQFVVVGGIWVPSPTEYAASVAPPGDTTSSFHPHTAGSAPPVSTSHQHPNQIQSTTSTTVRNSTKSSSEEERGSRSRLSSGHSNGRCNSPATSSSTHTTTTSPAATQAH